MIILKKILKIVALNAKIVCTFHSNDILSRNGLGELCDDYFGTSEDYEGLDT